MSSRTESIPKVGQEAIRAGREWEIGAELQIELGKLNRNVNERGRRFVVISKRREADGKDGTIKAHRAELEYAPGAKVRIVARQAQ